MTRDKVAHDRVFMVPPGPGGVADFAASLQEPCDVVETVDHRIEWPSLAGKSVLIHYSGYGYQRRGVPLSLLVNVARHRSSFARLGVFVHETWASGPVTSSAFWLSGLQRFIVRRLVAMSDYWIASNQESYTRVAAGPATASRGRVMPVPSTVGEPQSQPIEAKTSIVVFGSGPRRAAVWDAHHDALVRLSQHLGLELVDIGPPLPNASDLEAIGVRVAGRIPADEVRTELSLARYGIVDYPQNLLAKSSIFGAYCAHHVVAVVVREGSFSADGLESGSHYVHGIDRVPDVDAQASVIAAQAFEWYQPHSIGKHAELHNELM